MRFTIPLVVCGGLAAACGSDPKEPPAAPVGETSQPTATAEASAPPAAVDPGDDGKDPGRSQINISDEIKKACGISDAEAKFAFNSSQLRPQDHAILGKLSACFTSGPLSGRQMLLVGHTDPRGDEHYNMSLGERRAYSVQQFLVQKGMKSDQMSTSSRGELDASGTDETSWALDRRVDVKLGE